MTQEQFEIALRDQQIRALSQRCLALDVELAACRERVAKLEAENADTKSAG